MILEMVDFILQHHEIDVTKTKRRYEPVVMSRAALFNACRGFLSSTQLGKFFSMNHATVLHHQKNHDALLMVQYYRQLYFRLMEIRKEYDEFAQEIHDETEKRFHELASQHRILLWKYERLKKDYEKVTA